MSTGRPQRCAWENTTQGFPRKPISELVKLIVDGKEERPTLVTRKRPGGMALADHYHQFHLASPAAGRHTTTATVRVLASGAEASRTVGFHV